MNWLGDLVAKERLVDAPMHFTTPKLAESLSLAWILSSTEQRQELTENRDRTYLKNLGRTINAHKTLRYLDRAEQSFSMGRQYYANIKWLYYLYDDFNDRSRHAEHASAMMQADLIAIYSAMVRETWPSAGDDR